MHFSMQKDHQEPIVTFFDRSRLGLEVLGTACFDGVVSTFFVVSFFVEEEDSGGADE